MSAMDKLRNADKESMEEEMVTITKKEFKRLQKRELWLECLEGAGVDNWEGYDDAYAMRREAEEGE